MENEPLQAAAPHVAWTPAEIGALAHLYRGEMYQSKIWRGRLDTTTNWAVVVTGIALSVTFTSEHASPMPLLLVSWVVVMFLLFESRRYLFYDLFRVRLRVMEMNFYAPMLRGEGIQTANGWNDLLAGDYMHLHFHISLLESVGRRIRRTYGWLFFAQLACWVAKIVVHPTPLTTFEQIWERAAIGPLSGQAVVVIGALFHLTWIAIALLTLGGQRAVGLPTGRIGPDPLLGVAGGHSET
jgi:uncharacterized membrane protein